MTKGQELSTSGACIVPVILCGGEGSRLWPLSTSSLPKPFLTFPPYEHSLFQLTLQRTAVEGFTTAPLILCNQRHRFIAAAQADALGITPLSLVLEPEGKGSAPAAAVAAQLVQRLGIRNAVLWVVPADHLLSPAAALHEAVVEASSLARQGRMVTFGIQPHSAKPDYGYILPGRAAGAGFAIRQFMEKPSAEVAAQLITQGALWNSGMFCFTAEHYLHVLEKLQPAIASTMHYATAQAAQDGDFLRLHTKAFATCPSQSIDRGIMEHVKDGAVIPLHLEEWRDVGTWEALYDHMDKDRAGNAYQGEVRATDCHNCQVIAEERPVTLLGTEGLLVVDRPEGVVITPRSQAHTLAQYAKLPGNNKKEYRPWGWYTTLYEEEGYKVKKLALKPGGSISLQKHLRRAEHWVVLSGKAHVTVGDKIHSLLAGQSFTIPKGHLHRLENASPEFLMVIEIQTGEYLGEDDIVRVADAYGRVSVV